MGIYIYRQPVYPGSTNLIYPKTGYWMSHPGTIGAGAPSQSVVRYLPIDLPPGTALDRIGIEHTVAGGVGSVIRLGIYNDDGFGQPGSLLIDAGTVDATVAAAFQSITISVSTQTPRSHMCAVSQGSASVPTIRFVQNTTRDPYWTTSNMTSAQNNAVSGVAAGALPATASVTGASSTAPFIQVRIA